MANHHINELSSVVSSGVCKKNIPEKKSFEPSDYCGPFELLQARQLLECNVSEFSATHVTKMDINSLFLLQKSYKSNCINYLEYDKKFHIQIAKATKNSVLVMLVSDIFRQQEKNVQLNNLFNLLENKNFIFSSHEKIIRSLFKRDPKEIKSLMWKHFEDIKQRLSTIDIRGDDIDDRFLFSKGIVNMSDLQKNPAHRQMS